MTTTRSDGSGGSEPPTLGRALAQSRDVQVKAEAVAEDIGSIKNQVKKQIADGQTTVSARAALTTGVKVEKQVKEVAEELHEVNEALAKGIAQLKEIENAFVHAQEQLVRTEAALGTARHEERNARLRALHDSTTGLPNRDLFNDRIEHAISLADRHDWTLAVMFLDLDGFKTVNDTHGHSAGDAVLQEVAKRLLAHCRHEDSVCRTGGDEFLYLLMNPKGVANVKRIALELVRSISRAIDTGEVQVVVKPSIGIAMYPVDGVDGPMLVRNADAAMYKAKNGAHGYLFFDSLTASPPGHGS